MSDILSRKLTGHELEAVAAMRAITFNETRTANPELADVVTADGIDDDSDAIEVDRGVIVTAGSPKRDVFEIVAALLLWLFIAGAVFGAVIQAVGK
ncbi:hypothetical protein F8M49_29940 [Rhodococcus zopfii]|uniref:Uncharacterized protein n=1 Tax=Rhodococcus zopfii TaxID=43772 RepID=A0ABU3WJP4_9NOCA|nr:hypothetical protein [Rhodococcus zopfii]MDV2478584.1 hypothetical protein [Rhodococcus zopfii]